MSFNHQVKYRGCVQVAHFMKTPSQPRPGLIEANQCVKQILSQVKQSSVVVLSVSADNGIKCVDTNVSPPKVVMRNSVYEIAHCGVDVSRPRMFTCIVGNKGEDAQFFCHVFKCESKEASSRITHAVAQACTTAYQKHKNKKGGASTSRPPAAASKSAGINRSRGASKPDHSAGDPNDARLQKMKDMRRASLKKRPSNAKPRIITKLTDEWFKPDMSRDDVNRKLKKARVGDFFVRESSSQVGNYAISVQTGKNIWTGLIHHSDDGFQLGNKGALLFDELTDLIGHHMANTFMNDDYGYPMSLRPNPIQEREQAKEKRSSGSRSSSTGSVGSPTQSGATGGWPDDDEDDGGASGGPSGGWPDDEDELETGKLSEMEEFERFMDSSHVLADDGPDSSDDEAPTPADVADLDQALSHLNMVQADLEADDDFNPRAGAPASNDPFAVPAAGTNTISSLAQTIYESLPQDEEGCLGGADIRPVLLTSGLEMQDLGGIWMEVDQDRRGKIDVDQLGLILGMIAQHQQGETPSLETLDPETAPCPTLEGY